MEGRDNWAVGAGIVMIIGGFILTGVGIFVLPILFYSIPMLIIGIVILMTLREQEYVEPIKGKGSKKIEPKERNKRRKR